MYKYYSLLRPVSMGTIPDCSVDTVQNFSQRKFVEEIGREAWGYFTTSDMLSEDKLDEYDLSSADVLNRKWQPVAEKISQFSKQTGDDLDIDDILAAVTSGNLEDITGYLIGYSKSDFKQEALTLFKEVNSLRNYS